MEAKHVWFIVLLLSCGMAAGAFAGEPSGASSSSSSGGASSSRPELTEDERRLLDAVTSGKAEMVKELLSNRNINVNAADGNGQTALIWAVRNRRAEVVRLLLDAGADVNAVNIFGYTALILAAANGSAGIVGMLLDACADVNAVDRDGLTALILAAIYGDDGDVDTVRMLLDNKNIKVDAADGNGQTALILAVMNRRSEAVRLLLDADADVNAVNHAGKTALDYASDPTSGNPAIANLLQHHGAKTSRELSGDAAAGSSSH